MAGEPELAYGAEGEWVTSVQQWLTHLGYYGGAADGSFGPATLAAVNALQAHYSVDEAGTVGPETWHLITMASSEDKVGLSHSWHGSEVNVVDVPEMSEEGAS
jgi:peptidoglycan hydrolase-like protein with peptidoglycan-binding domain